MRSAFYGLITDTVPPMLAMQIRSPPAFTATPCGAYPAAMVAATVFAAVSITDTVTNWATALDWVLT